MKDLRDSYFWDEKRKILTYNEIGITGIRLLGHDMRKNQKGSIKMHYHKDAMEITYVVQGLRTYSVQNEDNYASGGEAYITFANEPHSVGTKSQGFGEYFWAQISFEQVEGFLGLSHPWDKILYQRLQQLDVRKVKLNQQFSKQLEKCIHGFRSEDACERSDAHMIFLNFISALLDSKRHGENEFTEDINRAIEYIKNHLYQNIEFEDLAKVSGLSISGLKHKFGEQVGMPPMQYLNYAKVEEAKRLIEHDYKFNDIADKLGFASNSHFAAVFKKIMSISPTEYKERFEK